MDRRLDPIDASMGLAISRSIIERHGGRLWATPAAPHGTSFHVSLPANDPTQPSRVLAGEEVHP